MPAQNARARFPAEDFAAIVERFDTGDQDELLEAVGAAFRFCDRYRMPFSEAAKLAYAPDTGALAELRIREKQKDDEIAKFKAALAGLRSTCGQLKEQNAMLAEGAKLCPNCETWRRVLAGIAGALAAAGWCYAVLPVPVWAFWSVAGVLALGPVGGVYLRWRWFLFSRKIRFRSFIDNAIASAVLEVWRKL